jgi:cobalt/nickel transport system permease protein
LTPKWMISAEPAAVDQPLQLPLHSGNKGLRKRSFLEKTLVELTSVLQESVFSEAYASLPGLLQGLDPRVKFAALLFFLVVASLVHSIPVLVGIYLLTLVLAQLSRIGLPFFIKRVWLFIPIFAGIIALPAIFNVITPGEVWVPIFHLPRAYSWGPYHIPQVVGISRQGTMGALVFLCRVAASVSLVVLVTLSTRWDHLLKALRVVRIPQIFVLTLGMTYRYIQLLARLVQEMYWAKKSRTLKFSKIRAEQGWIASRMATLFRKSFQLSQQVHGAMRSRGFDGEARTLQTFQIRARDYVAILTSVFLGSLLLWWDRFL